MAGEVDKSVASAAETVFAAALTLLPAERSAYLAGACGNNSQLRDRVEVLLRAAEAPEGFLPEQHGPLAGFPLSFDIEAEFAGKEGVGGDRIGRYRVLQRIGEGGCGMVYLAEQEEPVRRRVALKVIKLGMDTRQVVARFEAERQALAMMDHPNIAKVLDAGATERGRPYFVMELVPGIKITDYCEQHKLSTRQRLELFIQVCRAIQHAHQKGVIHRDIKPSNVLITRQDGVAVPKIIDFGIAKATQGRLTDQTLFTAFEQFVGTPAYMSPEQARLGAVDIDTRSDIYSLGVLLYELLTGKTPFDTKQMMVGGLDEIRRTILEKEPVTPSTRIKQSRQTAQSGESQQSKIQNVKSQIDKDLDWIVMKCLEKDRARRYETANGLAMDIERHLKNEPVAAGPPGKFYRFRKLVRRNKRTFAAIAALTLVLVLGLALSTWQAVRASRAEQRSTTEGMKSEQVAKLLKEMLKSVGPSKALGRDTTMLKEILDRTAQRIGRELTNQPEVELEMRVTLANTYSELGDYRKVEEMALEGLRLAQTGAANATVTEPELLSILGLAQDRLGNYRQAELYFRQSLALLQKQHGPEHENIASVFQNLALALLHQGKLSEAVTHYRQSVAMTRKILGQENSSLATQLSNLADALADQGNFAEAEGLFAEALAIERKILAPEDPLLATSLTGLSHLYLRQNKLPLAETAIVEAVAINRKVLGNDHQDLGPSLNALADVFRRQGKLLDAENLTCEILRLEQKTMGENHPNFASSLHNLSIILRDEGKLDEAESTARQALALQLRLVGSDDPDIANQILSLGTIFQAQHKLFEAESALRECLEILRKRFGEEHPHTADSLDTLAAILFDQGKLVEARITYKEVAAIRRRLLGDQDENVARTLHHLARVLIAEGKLAEAESYSEEALAIARKAFGNDDPRLAIALRGLARIQEGLGKTAQAEISLREALHINRTVLGDTHPEVFQTVSNLMTVLQKQDKSEQAFELCRDHLTRARGQLPVDDPRLATGLSQLASCLIGFQKFAEAELLAQESLNIREKKSPDDWRTFHCRSQLGAALLGQRKYSDAEPLLVLGFAGMKQREDTIPPPEKARLKEAAQYMVQLFEATDRREQAIQWKQKLTEF